MGYVPSIDFKILVLESSIEEDKQQSFKILQEIEFFSSKKIISNNTTFYTNVSTKYSNISSTSTKATMNNDTNNINILRR